MPQKPCLKLLHGLNGPEVLLTYSHFWQTTLHQHLCKLCMLVIWFHKKKLFIFFLNIWTKYFIFRITIILSCWIFGTTLNVQNRSFRNTIDGTCCIEQFIFYASGCRCALFSTAFILDNKGKNAIKNYTFFKKIYK